MDALISEADVAGYIRTHLRLALPSRMDLTEGPDGPAFDFIAPATGQRFRITVTEVQDRAPDDPACLLSQEGQ